MESKIRVIKAAVVSPKTVIRLFAPFPSLSGVTLETLQGLLEVEGYQASCLSLWSEVLNPIDDGVDSGAIEIASDRLAGVVVVTYTSRSRFRLVPKWDGAWKAGSFNLVVEFPTPSKFRADEVLTTLSEVGSLEGVELLWEDGSSQVVKSEDEEEIWTRLGVRESN